MPNRILRANLFRSGRWLDLKNNTNRLAYIALIVEADDLGNLEANPRDLVRIWGEIGIDKPAPAELVWNDLVAADLVRPYTVGHKRYGHLPRWRQRLRYTKRVNPRPPADIECPEIKELLDGKTDSSQTRDGPQSDSSQTLVGLKRSRSRKEDEVKGRKTTPAAPALPDWLPLTDWQDYLKHRTAKRAPNSARALTEAIAELGKLRESGYAPKDVIAQSIFRGWIGLFPVRGNGGNGSAHHDARAEIARGHFQEELHEQPARDITGEATRLDEA